MDGYVSISQAAKLMQVSRPTVYRLIEQGKLTVYRKPAHKPRFSPGFIPLAQAEALKPRA